MKIAITGNIGSYLASSLDVLLTNFLNLKLDDRAFFLFKDDANMSIFSMFLSFKK